LFDAACGGFEFTEADTQHFMRQILMAVNYMHCKKIVHRDLKPENFLLKEAAPHLKNLVKVVDFGFARDFIPGTQDLKTKLGTPHYMAPEIIFQDGGYDEKCDVWSCGVILYQFLCGDMPFDGEATDQILEDARKKKPTFDDEVWKQVSPTAKLAVAQMLNKSPSNRVSAEKALRSPWLASSIQEPKTGVQGDIIVRRMQRFQQWGKFQKAAAHLIAHAMPDAQKDELRQTFEAMDKNNDGLLTLEELKEGLAGCSEVNMAEVDMVALFHEMDTDGEGHVEWTEFLAALSSQSMLSSKHACQEAFAVLDVDRDGRISLDELHQMLNLNKAPQALDEELEFFRCMDKNGDGVIEFDEFRQMMLDIQCCSNRKPAYAERRSRTKRFGHG